MNKWEYLIVQRHFDLWLMIQNKFKHNNKKSHPLLLNFYKNNKINNYNFYQQYLIKIIINYSLKIKDNNAIKVNRLNEIKLNWEI